MSVQIATTFEEGQVLATRILESGDITIGFDTETTILRSRDSEGGEPPCKYVSTIQVATSIGTMIFQTYRIWKEKQELPSALRRLLSSDNLIKVGVGIILDVEKLRLSYGGDYRGFIDVQYLAKTMKLPGISMVDLATKFLHLSDTTPIPLPGGEFIKDPFGHHGDWDNDLSPASIAYASRDAEMSLEIYYAMMNITPAVPPVHRETNDTNDLLRWVQMELSRAVTARSLNSLVNQIVNSYGPWRNRYIETDRRKMAQEILERLIEQGQLKFDSLRQEFPLGDTKETINSPSDVLPDTGDIEVAYTEYISKELIGMKVSSGINKMINSYKRWATKPMGERRRWVEYAIEQLTLQNRITVKAGLIYLDYHVEEVCC